MGTSYQKGWVEVRGKKWYGFYRRAILDPETNAPKIVRTTVILGLRSELTKTQAREKLAITITQQQGQVSEDGSVKNGSVTFGWLVRNRYLPLKEADWREETAKVKKLIITADLIIPFEGVPLENFDKYILQSHLNNLAKTHSTYFPRISEGISRQFPAANLSRVIAGGQPVRRSGARFHSPRSARVS